MYHEPIRVLQVDLVSACNAACPLCSRQSVTGGANEYFPRNMELPIELFRAALRDPSLAQLEEIFFCGNLGDALGSPHLLDFLNAVDEGSAGKIRWNIHTNGSLGNEEIWKELGRRAIGGRLVKFALDGLADTNGLYRRGVQWQRVERNARAFLEAGGRGVWKFIVFQHNRHQIEEARALAKEWGFIRFEVRENYAPQLEPLPTAGKPLWDEAREVVPVRRGRPRCRSQKERSLYLDFQGKIWPCCWLASWEFDASRAKREWHKKHATYLREDEHSLRFLPLGKILEGNWFREELERSWENPTSSFAHNACWQYCATTAEGTKFGA